VNRRKAYLTLRFYCGVPNRDYESIALFGVAVHYPSNMREICIWFSTQFVQGALENLTVFEFLKPACPLRGAYILTVIVHSVVWCLFDMGMYISVLINFSTLP
jgi:hypothetical protein